MKISKIFHTLYGFLMCLPIISILFVCVYVSVNPNAKDSYSGSEIQYRQVEYQTNEVNSLDDLVVGNVYELKWFIALDYSYQSNVYIGEYTDFKFINNEHLNVINDTAKYLIIKTVAQAEGNFLIARYNLNHAGGSIYYALYSVRPYINNYFSIYFVYTGLSSSITNDAINYIFEVNDLSLIPPQYEEVEVQKLDNAFYYSVNELNDNPLFSWAQNSFLVAPITYVVSLFGMTNSSPIVTMLSYWLTISIIWLVFDLIMYIPLLVHRWIDKGVVE